MCNGDGSELYLKTGPSNFNSYTNKSSENICSSSSGSSVEGINLSKHILNASPYRIS